MSFNVYLVCLIRLYRQRILYKTLIFFECIAAGSLISSEEENVAVSQTIEVRGFIVSDRERHRWFSLDVGRYINPHLQLQS